MTTARAAAGARASDWLTLYPRRRGSWPGVGADGPVTYDPDRRTITRADPRGDPKLPALADWLEAGELVAYRPRSRAVVRVDTAARSWFVKIAGSERLQRTLAAEQAVARALGGPGVVKAAAILHGGAAYPAAPGESLHRLLRAGADRPELEAVGEAVARVHRAPLPPDLAEISTYTLGDWAGWALDHDPDCPQWLPARALEIAGSVLVEAEAPVLSHGDLHDKNVFVGPAGVDFIDIGSAGWAPPSVDLGMLAGHVVLRAVQFGRGWSEGYRAARIMTEAYWSAGGPATPAGSRARTAETLARLACLYRLRRRWHHITPVLLEAASGVIQ